MNRVFLGLGLAVSALLILQPKTEAAEGKTQSQRLKAVLRHEAGKDRHWIIKSDGLIVEEHGLLAHGDLHLKIEYPKGVLTPQLDMPNRDTNVVSVATLFWRNGRRMSCTPAVGDVPNGTDTLWWPNGKIFREAHYMMGTPTGVWKYYNQKGKPVGEGTFIKGKRQNGIFIGDDRDGWQFFYTSYPIKLQRYVDGVLKEEQEFLKELKLQ